MPLELREIRCRVGDLALYVDLSLRGGMLVAVAGPNGSGKTALLEIAAGLRQPESGEVVVSGRLEIARSSLDSADPQTDSPLDRRGAGARAGCLAYRCRLRSSRFRLSG